MLLPEDATPAVTFGPWSLFLKISIVIATFRRAASLSGTLRSIAATRFPSEDIQVVVADNADDTDTRRLCERYASRFPLAYVVETAPGKNSALNAALPRATGDLLLFTDDDVEVRPDWLTEMRDAARRWPEHAVFGGKVLPIWPSACPPHLRDRRYLGMCFSVLDSTDAEGPSLGFTPFGPNMAIRRQIFDAGVRFNPRVGPRQASYIMGSETELVWQLKNQGSVPVYVPRSIVRHRIRPEQFTDRWLLGRAFRYGRLVELRRRAAEGGGGWPALRNVPELVRSAARAGVAAARRDRKARFDCLMDMATSWGMIYQTWQPAPVRRTPHVSRMYATSPMELET